MPLQESNTPANNAPPPIDDAPEPMAVDPPDEAEVELDPWTDEQETSLFKSMTRWKPVGSFF